MIFKKRLTTVHISRNFFFDNAIPLQGFECINICDSSFAGEGPRASSQRGIQHVATLNMEMPMMMVMIVMRMMARMMDDDEDDEDGSKGQFAERNMTP